MFTVSSKGHPSKKLGRSLKTEKQHIRQEKNKRQRTGDKRRLPWSEDTRQPERPRKRQKNVIIPAALPRQRLPAPLPVPSSYIYSRTDAYRRDMPLIPLDPYGARDPPRERNERYRDGRDPHLERRYAYRGGMGSHIDRPHPYVDDVNSYSRRRDPDPYRDGRDLFLEPRDLYRDGRDPYIERRDSYRDGRDIERRDSYRDGRDAYLERRDSYRDGRASYLERRVPYGDSTHSELYSTYRRPLSDSRDVYREDRGVELRDSYRRDELVGRRVLHPLDSETRNHHDIAGHDAYLSDRVRPSYAETLYPSAYPSRTDGYRL